MNSAPKSQDHTRCRTTNNPTSKTVQRIALSRRGSSGPNQVSPAAPISHKQPAVASCQVGQGTDMGHPLSMMPETWSTTYTQPVITFVLSLRVNGLVWRRKL